MDPKQINPVLGDIRFYEKKLKETHKFFLVTDSEFELLSPADQERCFIGWGGFRFMLVEITEEERQLWRGMIEDLKSRFD